jgi:propionate CoA-transferase
MDFAPIIHGEPRLMDARIFADGPMHMRAGMLERPLAERLAYDPAQNLFFVDFSGLAVRSEDDIARILEAVESRLMPIGHKVNAIVNYDRFTILPELIDDYIGIVKGLMERHYHEVTRYTSSTFLRMKLGEAMEKQQIPPRLYENADEAQGSLGKA